MEVIREVREVIQQLRQAFQNLEVAVKLLLFGTFANLLLSLLILLKLKDRK